MLCKKFNSTEFQFSFLLPWYHALGIRWWGPLDRHCLYLFVFLLEFISNKCTYESFYHASLRKQAVTYQGSYMCLVSKKPKSCWERKRKDTRTQLLCAVAANEKVMSSFFLSFRGQIAFLLLVSNCANLKRENDKKWAQKRNLFSSAQTFRQIRPINTCQKRELKRERDEQRKKNRSIKKKSGRTKKWMSHHWYITDTEIQFWV